MLEDSSTFLLTHVLTPTRVRALQGSALHLGNFLLEISCEMSSSGHV